MKIANVIKKNVESLRPAKSVDADILGPRLVFIICTLALLLFGLVMVFSASNVEAIDHDQSPFMYLFKQALFGVVGIIAAVAIWRWIPFSAWRGKFLWVIFGGLSILMVATLIGGTDILGARRWIVIGPISIQPSEYAKIVLVLVVAKYYAEYRIGHITFGKCVGVAGGLSAGMIGFILLGQSDLGTSIICVVGILSVLWIAGIPKWLFSSLVVMCLLGVVGVVIFSSWRSNRLIFLDPWNDGQGGYGAGYQLIRSIYAFSEGGFFGVGLGNSYEKYQYLPEAETDFIFSIVGEELGFIGCILVLAIFVAFLVSGMLIVARSSSRFAASVSGSFIVMIVFQALLNICCVVGLFPTTGKPLPFISSGGSSLLATLIMIGFVLASSEYEAMPDEYERRRRNFKASTNIEQPEKVQLADERIDAEIKKRVDQIRKRATTGVRPVTKRDVPKINTATVEAPKFIEDNKKQKTRTKSLTSNQSRTSTQRRPSVSSLAENRSSTVYRRKNTQPSFKPRKPIYGTGERKRESNDSKTSNRRGRR